jgi:hypothetical protein
MKYPRIAFCTTAKGRTGHLSRTLPKNIAHNRYYPNAVFVVVDYGSPDYLLDYLKTEHAADIESGRLVVYSYPTAGAFNMAHAKNMAHRLGLLEGADILVNLDADNFTGPDFAKYIAEQFTLNRDLFLWARMIKDGPDRMTRGISGRIAVPKHAFLNSGGYDEQYTTWAPDDKDFHLRLARMGYTSQEIDPRFLNAIPHTDKMRFKEYRHAEGEPYGETWDAQKFQDDVHRNMESVNQSEITVANFGRIGCGIVYKNFDLNNQVFDPIQLDDIPTRVFGIGMHKTATTSLHYALKVLGYESGHWRNAHWAKAIWQEMTTFGHSLTLERFYAVCDLPITLLYKELDVAYPRSKFILTIRHDDKWIEAIENHWSHDYNKFRASWDTDPFTHRVHKMLYGQKGFNRELFLARYRRHNAEVLEYFRERPNDLLVMNVDAGDGWTPLCRFLKQPIPQIEYPNIDPVAKGV